MMVQRIDRSRPGQVQPKPKAEEILIEEILKAAGLEALD